MVRRIETEYAVLSSECRGRAAYLREVVGTEPWSVVETEFGPDEDVEAILQSGPDEVRIEVYCTRGVPQPVVFD